MMSSGWVGLTACRCLRLRSSHLTDRAMCFLEELKHRNAGVTKNHMATDTEMGCDCTTKRLHSGSLSGLSQLKYG